MEPSDGHLLIVIGEPTAARSWDNDVLCGRLYRPLGTSFVLGAEQRESSRATECDGGIHPLIDCTLVLFAEVLGLYERHGLDVELRREVSWSNIRDKVAVGPLDAAHMLSPMTLHLNGNSITLSNAVWQEIEQVAPQFVGDNLQSGAPLAAYALAAVIRHRAANGSDRAFARPSRLPHLPSPARELPLADRKVESAHGDPRILPTNGAGSDGTGRLHRRLRLRPQL